MTLKQHSAPICSSLLLIAFAGTIASASEPIIVGYWLLDEDEHPSSVIDEIGTSHGQEYEEVEFGGSGAFTGSTSAKFEERKYIVIPHHDDFLLDSGTVSFWICPSKTSKRMGLFSKDSTNYDTGGHLTFFQESSNKIKVRLQSQNTSYYVDSTSSISLNEWHHIALVFGPGGMELYFDGLLEDTNPYEGGLGSTSGGSGNFEPIVLDGNSWKSNDLGATPLYDYYYGKLDDVSIIDGQLSASAIARISGVELTEALFTDISVTSGFNVSLGSGANGIHWADMDNDGDLDPILTGSSAKLLWNTASSETFSPRSIGNMSRQGAIGDMDNDGDLDFWHRNLDLWENVGLGAMIDRGSLGFISPYNTENVALIDVNTDGRLDVVMASQDGNWIALNSDPGEDETTRIVLSESKNTSDGMHVSGAYGNGDFSSTADFNNDGHLDMFYHYGDGELFLSDGDGTFTHQSTAIQIVTGNSDKMGSAAGDFDNDGDMDLFVSRYDSGQPGYLWRNDGNAVFTNIPSSAGIADTGNQRGCAWGDYDNDGNLDLAIARQGQGLVVYKNNGDGTFTKSTDFPSVTGATTDVCFVDFNNDGNLDLSITREGESAVILRNDAESTDYLMMRYQGTSQVNGAGIGVRMELWDSSDTTFVARREIGLARGYGGQEPLWLHFGGVTPSNTYTLRVYEPGSINPRRVTVTPATASTSFTNQSISQFLTVTEGNSRVRVVQWKEVGAEGNR